MPRLFTGIEVPDSLAARIALLRSGLAGAHWTGPENYHITLRFAGDIDDSVARDFAAALAEINADCFDIEIAGLGSFGGRRPRALWAAIKMTQTLERLQKAHERAARLAGLAPETRNFTPHITLARLRDTRPRALAEYLSIYGGFGCEPFRVNRFVLFSARANQGGGPYLIEEVFELNGAFPEAGGEEAGLPGSV